MRLGALNTQKGSISNVCDAENMGTTRYDNTHNAAMICNGTAWQPVEEYAGAFFRTEAYGNTTCAIPNPYTGNCTCPGAPSVFRQVPLYGFGQGVHGDGDDCIKDDGIMNYLYLPETNTSSRITDSTRGCGFNATLCVPSGFTSSIRPP